MHKRQFVLALMLFLLLFLVLNFVNAQTIQDYNLTYDANGNMIQGFGEYIEYDAWNRLSKIRNTNATGTVIAEYLYDHEGNRIKKIVYNSNGDGHNESTYYMNTRPADFIQVINTNGTILNETYIYLQDKLIAKYDTQGEKFFYHPDHLGSTSLVTNESGDVVEDLLYLPYGDVLSGDEISRFTYTGQENDVESGFIDYGARQYNPQFARFLQCDKVKQNVYDPQLLNCYSYVRNNPYKYTDPTGNYISPLDVLDYASLTQSIYMFKNDPNTKNAIFLAVDVAFAATPIIGGAGFAVKGADKAAKAILGKIGKNGDSTGGLLNDLDEAVAGSGNSGGKTAGGGSNFASDKLSESHFKDHGAEFGFTSEKEYSQAAQKLIDSKTGKGIEGYTRPNGDVVRYDTKTNSYAVKTKDGVIKTYFKPTEGYNYYQRDKNKYQKNTKRT